jgi:hypothetical protein
MKNLTLLTAVALACCMVSPLVAQVQILRSGTPTPAPRLVADQTALAEVEPLPIQSPTASPQIPNPFDYFDQGFSAKETPTESPVSLAEPPQTEPLASESPIAEKAAESDPASLPVGRHHRQNSPTIVDTIVSHATLGNIPNAAVTPVYWGGAPQTPNPVAQWSLREQCVDGLWANYQQQRAAECAHMWEHLNGHGCGIACVTGPCTACSQHAHQAAAPRRNRYLERFTARKPAKCDTGAQPTLAATACDSCQSAYGQAAPGCSDCVQKNSPAQLGSDTPTMDVAGLPPVETFR